MTIGIIIATHGHSAAQLLKTAEMLIGEQNLVKALGFVAGENGDDLFNKYSVAVDELKASGATDFLFFVDIWGGTPFNAAQRFTAEQVNMNVITGVNVPMLVEGLMGREDDPSFEELAKVALEAGSSSVRALKGFQKTEEKAPEAAQAPVEAALATEKVYAMPDIAAVDTKNALVIALSRIDDRLIHGQVATRWTKETNISRIIVINDDIAKDKMRVTMLKQAVPPGVSAHVVSIDKMLRVYANPEYAGERVLLLFTNPTDVLRLIEAQMPIKSVNIGGISHREGKQMITNAVAVGAEDIAAFKRLDELGIELEIRKVSSDRKEFVMTLLKDKNLL